MQMAIELGTPGTHPALWGQGLVSLGHPFRSVSLRLFLKEVWEAMGFLPVRLRTRKTPYFYAGLLSIR